MYSSMTNQLQFTLDQSISSRMRPPFFTVRFSSTPLIRPFSGSVRLSPIHDLPRRPGIGFHDRPPSLVENTPVGKASVQSPATTPFCSSKNCTAFKPGNSVLVTSRHVVPPSAVESTTPCDPAP